MFKLVAMYELASLLENNSKQLQSASLCTPGEYVSMSNGIFNFKFQLSFFLLTEILGGSQIYTTGHYAPWTPPSGEFFLPKASTSQYLSEILRFCDFFVVLSCPVLSWLYFFFSQLRPGRTPGQNLTIYGLNDASSPKDVPFGGLSDHPQY